MSTSNPKDLSQLSMLELFRAEAENQTAVLVAGLLELEQNPRAGRRLEELLRAAHCLKGAARIVNLDAAVRIAHALEDVFVAAQRSGIYFQREGIDALFSAVDLIGRIAHTTEGEMGRWTGGDAALVDAVAGRLSELSGGSNAPTRAPTPSPGLARARGDTAHVSAAPATPARHEPKPSSAAGGRDTSDRVLRVTAERLNRLLGLAGESLVESRWLSPFAESLLRLKRLQTELSHELEGLAVSRDSANELTRTHLQQAQSKVAACRQLLAERLAELEQFDRRSMQLSHRLYHEALACRMRPFSDGVQAFPRMVRDLARSLGKEAKLELIGAATQVDRDLLEKLEAPLTHLLRNAVDHGLESPEERRLAGKTSTGLIRLEAHHSLGRLTILVADDGRGIAFDQVRAEIVRRGLTSADTAAGLSEAELLEFLYLPGFSLKESVTEWSGRGIGLDVVRSMLQQVRGTIRSYAQPGKGARFQLQLPLTLSVVRTLLVEIGGEPYAFPLASLAHTLKLSRHHVRSLEGCHHFELDGRQVAMVSAHQLLNQGQPKLAGDHWPVVIVSDTDGLYGLVVDRFLGERELVVHPLDARLGKIKDISAGALMEDGAPVLIVDVEDMVRSIAKLAGTGALRPLRAEAGPVAAPLPKRKRILVIDDSVTVRELQRKVLVSRGYEVELAVDGMDGWNAAREGRFHLIITDIDMPRMNGIELVAQLKRDARLSSIPAMVVSYKDRDEDRRRGLEAGADYYLSKGSFHDETLIAAVRDLIGEAA